MAYKLQSRSSEGQISARQTLTRLFESSPIPTEEMLQNLGLFIRSGVFSRFLFLDELYRQIVAVPGDVVELQYRIDDVAVRNDLVDQVVEAIVKAAKTGKVGDGKIFITDINRVIRIRTGETDDSAL